MGKHLDDADKTIAIAAKKHPQWLAWRLAVDSDLAALKTRDSAKAIAGKPGTAKKLGDGNLAIDSHGNLAFDNWTMWGGPGTPSTTVFEIYDSTGAVVFTLDGKNVKDEPAVLGALGFTPVKTTWLTANDVQSMFTGKDITVARTDKGLVVTRGKQAKTYPEPQYINLKRVGIAGDYLLLGGRDTVNCDSDHQRGTLNVIKL
ncbi:MAG: hypothetical protein QM831_41110 [Kofleriaceae bacterium]